MATVKWNIICIYHGGLFAICGFYLTSLVFLQFKQAVYKQTMKLFAELEIKRKEREAKDMHERWVTRCIYT